MSAKSKPTGKSASAGKKRPGRPRIELDRNQIETLAGIGCTIEEMAAVLSCSRDTLERNFAEEIAKGREKGKTRLRQAQLKAALGGNVVMLIFLGKNMLGQSDRMGLEHTGVNGGPIQTDSKGRTKEELAAFAAMVAKAEAEENQAHGEI